MKTKFAAKIIRWITENQKTSEYVNSIVLSMMF